MRRFKTGILVRDNRLEIMQNNGLVVDYDLLSDDEFIKELKNKLVEEAIELSSSKNLEEVIEEISDVLEVWEHIVESSGFDKNELKSIGKYEKDNSLSVSDIVVRKAHNVAGSVDLEELKQGLADFAYVLDKVISSNGLDFEKINQKKLNKRNELGGFSKKIKINHVDIDEGNFKEIEYYLSRPQKYPEILINPNKPNYNPR